MRKFFAMLLVPAFMLGGCAFTDGIKEVSEVVTPPSEQRGSFDDLYESFNSVYKSALLATGQEAASESGVESEVEETAAMWSKIESDYKDERPEGYEKTEDWTSVVAGIGDLVREAQELSGQGSFVEAHERLEQVREWLREVREENEVQSLSDLMLSFHDTMEEVAAGEGKDHELLEELEAKLDLIVEWEAYRDDEVYVQMVADLKAVIGELRQSSGDEYDEALKKLKPAFVRLYMSYG